MEKAQANALMDVVGQFPGQKEAEEGLKYHMQFRQRAIFFRFQTERVLKPVLERFTREELLELPESFRFENCAYCREFAALLKGNQRSCQ